MEDESKQVNGNNTNQTSGQQQLLVLLSALSYDGPHHNRLARLGGGLLFCIGQASALEVSGAGPCCGGWVLRSLLREAERAKERVDAALDVAGCERG